MGARLVQPAIAYPRGPLPASPLTGGRGVDGLSLSGISAAAGAEEFFGLRLEMVEIAEGLVAAQGVAAFEAVDKMPGGDRVGGRSPSRTNHARLPSLTPARNRPSVPMIENQA